MSAIRLAGLGFPEQPRGQTDWQATGYRPDAASERLVERNRQLWAENDELRDWVRWLEGRVAALEAR